MRGLRPIHALVLTTLVACSTASTVDGDGGTTPDQATLVFDGFQLIHRPAYCPYATTCQTTVGITSAVVRRMDIGGGDCAVAPSAADFTSFRALTTRADVQAALLDPNACPPVVGDVEQMSVGFTSGEVHENPSTAGCTAGPLADLRDAAMALADRYCPATASDAGAGND